MSRQMYFSVFVILATMLSANPVSAQRRIDNVIQSFKEMNDQGSRRNFAYNSSTAGQKPTEYNANLQKRHFQGIYPWSNGYIVTGSGASDGHIFLLTNNDTNVRTWRTVKTDAGLAASHAGGLQVIRDQNVEYAVLPLEIGKGQDSKVLFYEITSTPYFKFLYSINRKNVEAGAVGITKLLSGYFLLAVGRDSSNIIDFYISDAPNRLRDNPGWRIIDTWGEGELTSEIANDREFGNYQGLNLITESSGNVFLVGTHRNDASQHDFADLYRVNFSIDSRASGASDVRPAGSTSVSVTKIAKKRMHGIPGGIGGGMDAGAGVFINESGSLDACATALFWDNGPMPVYEYKSKKAVSSSGRKVRLVSLFCGDTTESGSDEIFIRIYKNDVLVKRVPASGHQKMKSNNSTKNWTINHDYEFKVDDTIKVIVMEDDGSSKDDHIGSITITKDTPTGGSGAVTQMRGSGSQYDMTWRVETVR